MRRSHFTLLAVALSCAVVIGLVNPAMAGQILYCVMTVMAFTFTMLYATRSNWRATAPGRALMYLVTMFAVFSAFVSTSYWLRGQYDDVRDVVRAGLLVVLIVMFTNLLITLFRIQQYRSEQEKHNTKICPIAEAEQEAHRENDRREHNRRRTSLDK